MLLISGWQVSTIKSGSALNESHNYDQYSLTHKLHATLQIWQQRTCIRQQLAVVPINILKKFLTLYATSTLVSITVRSSIRILHFGLSHPVARKHTKIDIRCIRGTQKNGIRCVSGIRCVHTLPPSRRYITFFGMWFLSDICVKPSGRTDIFVK